MVKSGKISVNRKSFIKRQIYKIFLERKKFTFQAEKQTLKS